MERDQGGRSVRRSSGWRSVLTWGLFWIAAVQVAAIVFLEWRHPEFLDPKYGCRMLALRVLREEHKDRPLLLTLGSSRAEQGFRPSLLARIGEMPVPPGPLFYNLARGGSSPLLYLLTLRRLLADGVHPDALLVEIFPPALVEDEKSAVISKPTLRDLPLLRRYPVSGRTWAFWLQDRLLLWYKYRSGFLAWAAPAWLPPQARWGANLWDYQGGEWRTVGSGVSLLEHRRLTDDAHRRYAHSLNHFRIAADADRALRELLDTCRSQRIGVVLFLMPEAREYRAWYPPAALRQLSDYLAGLHQEYDVPLIDARCWIEYSEFSDGHHLLNRGAAAFTRRFAAEVVASFRRAGSLRGRQ
ncbi:MAG TPA: hypothetical protein VMG10_27545 [Gemmataceae bacterium]|nr:hypothetical protein [Gemmataceae bacterium]